MGSGAEGGLVPTAYQLRSRGQHSAIEEVNIEHRTSNFELRTDQLDVRCLLFDVRRSYRVQIITTPQVDVPRYSIGASAGPL